jgi:hypothetical protein
MDLEWLVLTLFAMAAWKFWTKDDLAIYGSRVARNNIVCDDCVDMFDEGLKVQRRDIYAIEASASLGCHICAAVANGFNRLGERWPNQTILEKSQRRLILYSTTPTTYEQEFGSYEPSLDPFIGEVDEKLQYSLVSAMGQGRPPILDTYSSLTTIKLKGRVWLSL